MPRHEQDHFLHYWRTVEQGSPTNVPLFVLFRRLVEIGAATFLRLYFSKQIPTTKLHDIVFNWNQMRNTLTVSVWDSRRPLNSIVCLLCCRKNVPLRWRHHLSADSRWVHSQIAAFFYFFLMKQMFIKFIYIIKHTFLTYTIRCNGRFCVYYTVAVGL